MLAIPSCIPIVSSRHRRLRRLRFGGIHRVALQSALPQHVRVVSLCVCACVQKKIDIMRNGATKIKH